MVGLLASVTHSLADEISEECTPLHVCHEGAVTYSRRRSSKWPRRFERVQGLRRVVYDSEEAEGIKALREVAQTEFPIGAFSGWTLLTGQVGGSAVRLAAPRGIERRPPRYLGSGVYTNPNCLRTWKHAPRFNGRYEEARGRSEKNPARFTAPSI